MFNINFIARPGIQDETIIAAWSFISERINSPSEDSLDAHSSKQTTVHVFLKYFGSIMLILVGIFFSSIFYMNWQKKLDPNVVLNNIAQNKIPYTNDHVLKYFGSKVKTRNEYI